MPTNSEIELLSRGVALVEWANGRMRGNKTEIKESSKTLGQLRGVFRDVKQLNAMDPNRLVYRVQWAEPVSPGTEGGLFWGNTTIEPGRVGDEYFMTHGHFHAKRDRSEFYATVQGQGILVLVDESGRARAEEMRPGSLHYVGAGMAHRLANTGSLPLTVIACWPSDAGHDYESITRNGFGAHLICGDGVPTLVGEE